MGFTDDRRAHTERIGADLGTEQGDAGDLPETAQSTGSGTLSQIQGSLDVNDVDMYAIYITDPANFQCIYGRRRDL
jgi:hypothetical protein